MAAGAAGAFLARPALAQTPAAGPPKPPTIEALTRPPAVLGASLSPDGERIALLQEQWDGDKRAAFISLIKASDPASRPLRFSLGDRSVEGIRWATNERLLVSVLMRRDSKTRDFGTYMSEKVTTYSHRMMAINADGSNPVLLFNGQTDVLQNDPDLSVIVDMLPNDPQHILMRGWDPRAGMYALHKVDINTGKTTQVDRSGPDTISWHVQDGRAVLRWDALNRNTLMLYARAPGAEAWTFVRNVRPKSELWSADFEVIGATAEPGVFLAVAREADEQAMALRTFDVRTLKMGPVLAARPDRDVDGALVDEQGNYVAARFVTDRADYEFANKDVAPHYRGMDKFFGGEANVYVQDFNRDQTRFVVRAVGPQTPSDYYLYDRTARRFEAIGNSRPWLAPESLAKVEALDVKTRDGTVIRAYLTVPHAAGPRPLVVMPHGGPEVRDQLDFDVFAQALAAQGWLVLQPNFRGSGGYGRAFADAGRKRWGDRMQEDVEDCVTYLLGTGRADRDKVAIMGASYGGYAALMGAVRKPDLYKAVVSIAGVADLPDMMAAEKLDGADSPTYQYWLRTIGDPSTDAEALKAASPRMRAGEIKAPVLLIHGLDDRVVLPRQSQAMARTLKAAGKSVELVEIKDEGHSYWEPETTRAILQRSIDFIGKAFA